MNAPYDACDMKPNPPGSGSLRRMLGEAQHDRDIAHQARRNWLDTIDAVTDALMVHDAQLRVVRCNRAYATRAGMSFAEIIGRPYWECFPRRPGPLASAPHSEFRLDSGEAFVTRAFLIGHGETQETLHLFEDVTERRRREAQAHALQAIAASSFIFQGEVEQVARQLTEVAARTTGVARANVWLFNDAADELRCIDLFEPATGQHSSGMILREQQFANEFKTLKLAPYVDANDALTDPRASGYVDSYLRPLGITSMLDTVIEVEGRYLGLLCLEHVGRVHRWEADEIAFARRLADKISETLSYRRSRKAERGMRDSEEKYSALFASSRDAFMTLSPPEWKFTSGNPAALAMFGARDEGEVASRNPAALSPERQPDGALSADKAREMIAIALRDGNHFFDWTHRRLDGSEFPATVLLTRLQVQGQTLLNACVRDVTELRQAQAAVERRERFFHKVLEGGSDAHYVVDRNAKLLYRSESARRLTGYETFEVSGKDLTRLLAPESAAAASEGIAKVLSRPDEPSSVELRLTRRDGSVIDVEAVGRNLLSDPDVQGIVVTARDITARKAATAKIRASLEGAIGAIGATMEARDPYTAGHQHRVGSLGAAIAKEMALPAHVIEGIQFGGVIHDVGKIQVPAEILSKPTRLTKLESELVKVHPQAGYDIIKGIEFPWPIAQMVLQHHERLDGSGYPQGLKGEQIILEARVLAVADVVEAMSSHRPYRPGLGIDKALQEIEDKKGIWYDPVAVDACLRLFREKAFRL